VVGKKKPTSYKLKDCHKISITVKVVWFNRQLKKLYEKLTKNFNCKLCVLTEI